MKKTILTLLLLVSIAVSAVAAELSLPTIEGKRKTTIAVNGSDIGGMIAFDAWFQLPAGVHPAAVNECTTDLPNFAINCYEPPPGGVMRMSVYSDAPLPDDYGSGAIGYVRIAGQGSGPLSFVWAQAYSNFEPVPTNAVNGWLTLY